MESAGFGHVELDPTIDPRAPLGPAVGPTPRRRHRPVEGGGHRVGWLASRRGHRHPDRREFVVIGRIRGGPDQRPAPPGGGPSGRPSEVALLGQRVEHEAVGVPSGIMDQLISAGATAGHASLMDCRALTLTPVSLAGGHGDRRDGQRHTAHPRRCRLRRSACRVRTGGGGDGRHGVSRRHPRPSRGGVRRHRSSQGTPRDHRERPHTRGGRRDAGRRRRATRVADEREPSQLARRLRGVRAGSRRDRRRSPEPRRDASGPG